MKLRLFLTAGLVLATLGAALGFQREYTASLTVRDTPFRVMEKLAEAPPPAPASWRGIRNVMLGCLDAQTGIALRMQPASQRAAVHANCAQTAREILASAPTTSAAHLVLAIAALNTGDDGFAGHLASAQATAPREGWLVARRHGLGAEFFATLDAPSRDIWRSDTLVLLEERWGQGVVADTFIAQEALRPVIEDLVSTLPNAAQRGFVAEVQSRTRARQAS